MKFKNVLLSLLLVATSSFAMKKENIKTEMDKNIQEVLVHIKSKNDKGIVSVLDSIIDYETMAKVSLSTKWKDISDADKKDFSKAFETKLKNSYVDKLYMYNDQEVVVKDLKEAANGRLVLETEILSKKTADKYKISYKLYNKDDNWIIYDIDLLGVSILQTYRVQFSDYFKTPDRDIKTLTAELISKK